MSPQEIQVLQNFLEQLIQAPAVGKDAQAQGMINAAFSRQADAGYLLVQRALLQEQALASAHGQIAALQEQLRALQAQRSAPSGFLDAAAGAWGNSSRVASPPAAPVYAPPAVAATSGWPGTHAHLLGTVAATAAGVAAGAFLFQGMERWLEHDAPQQAASNGSAQLDGGEGGLLPGYFEREAEAGAASDAAGDSPPAPLEFD
ncbi:MAG: DUF2076 family protein [Burkholderiales bacterium]|nr:DUF2076 family protein [Burkholderiales bacterium]